MTHLICRVRVSDFGQWKRIFDSHDQAHQNAGLRLLHVWRSIDDPNLVFSQFEVTDLAKARAFTSAPEVEDAKSASGVVDTPDVWFLEQA